jgi:hypothetical protein
MFRTEDEAPAPRPRRAGRRRLLAALFAGAIMPGRAAATVPVVEERLRFALAVLCPRCVDDIEASGINHPMRRTLVARSALETVRDGLEAARRHGDTRRAAALRPVMRALVALESLDEAEAAWQARRALRMIESLPR